MRAALSARVSTSDQNTAVQLDELRKAATARGLTVVGEYVDNGVSGVKVSRPALDRMLADVAAGAIDVVVVYKLDRLGRTLSGIPWPGRPAADRRFGQGVARLKAGEPLTFRAPDH